MFEADIKDDCVENANYMKELSVIIPAYNEAERITPTLQRVNAYLGATPSASK
jgi:cellulose synthase/poly-beta-1,6-N-acetylglucosamine synthase-like glycosyltransferase